MSDGYCYTCDDPHFESEEAYNEWVVKRALHHLETSEYLFEKAMQMADEELDMSDSLKDIEW